MKIKNKKKKLGGQSSHIIRCALKTLFGGLLLCSPLLALAEPSTSGSLIDWFTSLLSVDDAGKIKTTIFVILSVVGTIALCSGIYGFYKISKSRPGDQETPSTKRCIHGFGWGLVMICAAVFVNMAGKTVGVDNAAQKASSGEVQFN
jgi:hypothetical protein